MRALRATALLLTAVLAGACGAGETPAGRAGEPAVPPVNTPAPARYVTEGTVGFHTAEPFTIAVMPVERHPGLTVLRMEITTTADRSAKGDFGYGSVPSDFARFRLLDPVGRKLYNTLREKDDSGAAFGTRHVLATSGYPEDFTPGVRYPVEVYFPPLPGAVEAVSVVPDMPIGPLTGIPVTDGDAAPVARERDPSAAPTSGQVFRWPVVPPSGEVWSWVTDLTELVESPQKTTTQEGPRETVGLRTDVLFAFDEATLNPTAAAVLDEVAAETRRRADPDEPPITITGHTDDRGDESYNMDLSLERARAVRDRLAARLGAGYRYRTEGKGETAPIAENRKPDGGDDPAGRARNRRVEVSYTIKQQGPDTTATAPAAGDVRGSALAPAPFRATPGPAAAHFDWTLHGTEQAMGVDVLPLYRDGAYLVASFDITNQRQEGFTLVAPQPFGRWGHEFSAGANLSAFTLLDPQTQTRYHPVKAHGFFVENAVPALDPGEVSRAYVYFPAPPDDRTSMTVEVAGGSAYPGIPISR
ncbi:OmpA family protein [Planomonospora sp. ID82291]|uniref:OmpA family protein n=1 Tax=Planomonospora sp. ID82291 TaxID=2738136 RepID=UPI0018C3D216|nr:OmpA family protein [Planomonospora sp. ID82291]MBG0816493.1 OmpA family protein [Planomonospora sp. ID82291]